MYISDGLGTYLNVWLTGGFVHMDAQARLTTLGLTYVVMLSFILYRIRRNRGRTTSH